jgi:hypothetical protein
LPESSDFHSGVVDPIVLEIDMVSGEPLA